MGKIHFVIGTRPDLIKMAPLIAEYQRRGRSFSIVHVGQHYDDNMDGIFSRQLSIPQGKRLVFPEEVRGKTPSWIYGHVYNRMYDMLKFDYDVPCVVVYGDTFGALACASAASRTGRTRVVHMEAGLRSYDLTMPEECARIQMDSLSDALFPPTERQSQILADEGVTGRRFVCGNLIVDALKMVEPTVPEWLGKADEFVLMTMHRPENVDYKPRLVAALKYVAATTSKTVYWPMHPRAAKKIEQFGVKLPECITTVSPTSYTDMVGLLKACSMVITDSGGLQEEACILGKRCLTLRTSTERPETIEIGANLLVDVLGVNGEPVVQGQYRDGWSHPYGENVASKIADVFDKEFT